ncbi:hypothetical protein PMIN06_003617 [Paraphaeosphaeria minitans]
MVNALNQMPPSATNALTMIARNMTCYRMHDWICKLLTLLLGGESESEPEPEYGVSLTSLSKSERIVIQIVLHYASKVLRTNTWRVRGLPQTRREGCTSC